MLQGMMATGGDGGDDGDGICHVVKHECAVARGVRICRVDGSFSTRTMIRAEEARNCVSLSSAQQSPAAIDIK
jgi:hypothetical protein